ncbi:MAG: hypothetical protein JNM50_09955 [Chromatiales bacterium]|nr:hypothetical protein [Chromatiales bacterium]
MAQPASAPLPAALLMRFLERRGAGSVPHLRNTLLGHLRAVHDLLVEWHGPGGLATAGLLHSFYGSDRLHHALGGAAERPVLRQLLGPELEQLVWLYGACDFAWLQAAVAREGRPAYRDRHTGEVRDLPAAVPLPLCELMVANEVDLATRSPSYREKRLGLLEDFASRWRDVLSAPAIAGVGRVLAAPDAAVPAPAPGAPAAP